MTKTSNLDQSRKQKLPSSSLIVSASRMPGPVTISANDGRQPKSHETPKEYFQKTYKAQHSYDQAGCSHQAPMLRRWLDGDSPRKAGQLGDRDGYPKGGPGMSQYLNDWDRAWHRAGNQANNKDFGKHLSKDFK